MYYMDPPMIGVPKFPGLSLYWIVAVPITVATAVLPAFGGSIFSWLVHTKSDIVTLLINITMMGLIVGLELYAYFHSQDLTQDVFAAFYDVMEAIYVIMFLFPLTVVAAYAIMENTRTTPWIPGLLGIPRYAMRSIYKGRSSIALVDLGVGAAFYLLYWWMIYDGYLYLLNYFLIGLFFGYRFVRWAWGRYPAIGKSISQRTVVVNSRDRIRRIVGKTPKRA